MLVSRQKLLYSLEHHLSPVLIVKMSDDEPEYEVERILAQRNKHGKTHYLVKWAGFPDEECSWEPREHFMDEATLVEWQRQYAEGDYLNEAEIAVLEVKMKQWSERQRAQNEDIVAGSPELSLPSDSGNPESLPESPAYSPPTTETQSPSVPPLPPKAQSTSENRRNSSFGSREPPAKRPKVQEPTRPDVQTKPHTSSASNSLSRIPSFGPKKGVTTKLPIQSSSALTHAAKSLQDRTGERYKNLRHMNNAMKFARRERTPDIRKLDLRAPGDFAVPQNIQEVQEQDASPRNREESPLFVPETVPEPTPGVSTESHFLAALSPSPADVPQAGEKSKALPPMSMSSPKSSPRGRRKVSTHSKEGISQPSSPVRQPVRRGLVHSTQTSCSRSRTREPPKERHVVATRPQAANSSLASIARRDDLTSSRKLPEVSEGDAGASRVPIPPSASSPQSPTRESLKERPVTSRSITQPSNSNLASLARRDTSSSLRRFSDVPDSDFQPLPVPNLPPSGQSGQVFTARNGRSWYWGEIVVLLRYGDHPVGHVKILGLPHWLVVRLISTKQRSPELTIHFEERNVMDKLRFSAFASQVSPTWYPGVHH